MAEMKKLWIIMNREEWHETVIELEMCRERERERGALRREKRKD